MRRIGWFGLWNLCLGVAAMAVCTGCMLSEPVVQDTEDGVDGKWDVPQRYSFERLNDAGYDISYTGQTLRHVLILTLKDHIESLTDRIDLDEVHVLHGDIMAELDMFYQYNGELSAMRAHPLVTDPPTKQGTLGEIAAGKTLRGKVAGNDSEGQHLSWGDVPLGWQAQGIKTPDALLIHWFRQIENTAMDRSQGVIGKDPYGEPLTKVYVGAAGIDYNQLIQKYLLGVVAYSQGTDDYLDDDIEGKGLLSDNTLVIKGKGYSALAHAWDEAFGYFGAARDYGDYDDNERAGKGGRDGFKEGYHDSNTDGMIDLHAEMNFGHSINAAKRDRGSHVDAPTDFTKDVFDAFLRGRAIIHSARGALTSTQMAALKDARDQLVQGWEKTIAANVVHYINEVLQDMAAFGTDEYKFLKHAKHWSEMKGFALSLQFNPRAMLTKSKYADFHARVGDQPVLPVDEGWSAYRQALVQARDILKITYDFDEKNIGGLDGEDGW